MSWAFGTNHGGREIGYGVGAVCDEEGCGEHIDRGLAYVCGGMHDGTSPRTGEQVGCGGYFCQEGHLSYYFREVREDTHPTALRVEDGEMSEQLCRDCGKAWQERTELVPA